MLPFIEMCRDIELPRRTKLGFLSSFKGGVDSFMPYLGVVIVGIVVVYALISGAV